MLVILSSLSPLIFFAYELFPNVEEATIPCMEIVHSDGESDGDIDVMDNVNFTLCYFLYRCVNVRKCMLQFLK